MDPYLEDPDLWPDVHTELISGARAFLNERIGPKYFVRIEERVYISGEDDPGRALIVPDIRIGKRRKGKSRSNGRRKTPVLEAAEPVEITTLLEAEIHETHLEIIDKKERHLVTVIEVVSPSNKIAFSSGRESYQKKRMEIMSSPTHWVEIDLLRDGEPVISQSVAQADYLVHVSRVGQRPKGHVWPIQLPQRLPVVLIPLRSPDSDVKLDLQAVLNAAYDRAGYDRTLDYRKPPVVGLSRKYGEWANRLLRKAGYR
jgi:hypothetical protein